MKLAATGRTIGVQRFKELNRSGYNKRCIPVFRGKGFSVKRWISFSLRYREIRPRVMLYHIFLPYNFAEHFCCLVYNGGIRDNIDDPLFSGSNGVGQSKCQGRYGFSAASTAEDSIRAW